MRQIPETNSVDEEESLGFVWNEFKNALHAPCDDFNEWKWLWRLSIASFRSIPFSKELTKIVDVFAQEVLPIIFVGIVILIEYLMLGQVLQDSLSGTTTCEMNSVDQNHTTRFGILSRLIVVLFISFGVLYFGIMVLWNFFDTCRTSPGLIIREEEEVEKDLYCGSSYLWKYKVDIPSEIEICKFWKESFEGEGFVQRNSHCLTCGPRPSRSHHCRKCGFCVLEMDHHCTFIGRCIGYGNYRSFIFMLLYLTMGCWFVLFSSMFLHFSLTKESLDNVDNRKMLYFTPLRICWLMTPLVIVTSLLLGWHIMIRVFQDKTTIEAIADNSIATKYNSRRSKDIYKHLVGDNMLLGIFPFSSRNQWHSRVTASALYEKKKYNMTTSPDYKYGSVNDIEKQESSLITSSTRDSHSHRHHTHVSELEGANEKLVAMATTGQRVMLRNLAIQGSLVINVTILLVKAVAYYRTLSLSVLAALVDSLLDVVSQVVLYFAERHAKENHSSALYPAGASRMEPIGVLTCAALMGIASFEVLQESINSIFFGHEDMNLSSIHISSVLSMMTIVLVKVGLLKLCEYAAADGGSAIIGDSTLEALAQDHLNDALSNFVAAIALISTYLAPSLWFFDPVGAIFISLYIIHSWYSTGKEMIEQLIGKAAPEDFIDEIIEIASKHDTRMTVDVCRAYHFGPKFLVELEVVLPADMPLIQSHDIGMDLQYEIEGLEEVERCFVHIDYEKRDYDEHVVSKVPELRQKYTKKSSTSSVDSNGSLISRTSSNSSGNEIKIA